MPAPYFQNLSLDDRSEFANKVFKLLYNKYKGDFENSNFKREATDLAIYLEEYVRNIYECIDREIPMMAWTNYMYYGFDSSAWDEGEMTEDQWKSIIFDACKRFYSED